MFFQNINYIAVILAVVASLVVGFIWYSPWVFFKPWARAKGRALEDIGKDTQSGVRQKGMAAGWIATVIASSISAFVIAALYNSLIVTSFWGMIVLAVALWAAFVVPVKLSDATFGKEGWVVFGITAGYYLVSITVMSLIIGIWG